MPVDMTSRERMLAAMACEPVDYVPCSFMIFEALRSQCADHAEFVDRQIELGLDALVDVSAWGGGRPEGQADLPGVAAAWSDRVDVSHWRETPSDSPYELLCKEIATPDGALTAKVNLTADWDHLDAVPLFDDWLVPRSHEFLVKTREDLPALRHVLAPPSQDATTNMADLVASARSFADDRGLAVQSGWGVGIEAGLWLCGFERLAWAAIEEPEFVDDLAALLHEWNASRMKPLLDAGIDLFIRRGWYEGTTFWSPAQFRQFVFPSLKAEADLAHAAGTKFGYISTSGTMGVLDMLLEAGVDVLIGVDPVQGQDTDVAAMREMTRGRMSLWGGCNGFVTVETGSAAAVRREVRDAMAALGPEGFILSPVDNVKDTSESTWRNVEALIDEWRAAR